MVTLSLEEVAVRLLCAAGAGAVFGAERVPFEQIVTLHLKHERSRDLSLPEQLAKELMALDSVCRFQWR